MLNYEACLVPSRVQRFSHISQTPWWLMTWKSEEHTQDTFFERWEIINLATLSGLTHQHSQLWAESMASWKCPLLAMLYLLTSKKAFLVHFPYCYIVIIETTRLHSFYMSDQCTLFGDTLVHWFLMHFGVMGNSYNLRKVYGHIPPEKCTGKITK